MRLIGYIKELIGNSFTIPIYNSSSKYYTHNVDESFRITHFDELDFNLNDYKPLYSAKNFEIGSIASLVFIGKDNVIFYGEATTAVENIIYYLQETTSPGEFLNTKKEVAHLQSILNKISNSSFTELKNCNLDFWKSIMISDQEKDFHYISPQAREHLFNSTGIVRYSLDEYIKNVPIRLQHKWPEELRVSLEVIPEIIIKELKIEYKDKEILLYIFNEFISEVSDKLEDKWLKDIRNTFSKYLDSKRKDYLYNTENTILEILQTKAEERKAKMQEWNYKFNDQFLWEMENIPAYKRMGIELITKSQTYTNFKINDLIDQDENLKKDKLLNIFKYFAAKDDNIL